MAVQLWKDGPNGPEMVLIEPEVFNMSFLDAGYRFTEQPEPEKEEDEPTKTPKKNPMGPKKEKQMPEKNPGSKKKC